MELLQDNNLPTAQEGETLEAAAKRSKNIKVAMTGSSSTFITGAGLCCMLMGGAPVFILGGILVGAGVGGTAGSLQQAQNKRKKFSYRKWYRGTTIGAAGGGTYAAASIGGAGLIVYYGIQNIIAKTALTITKEVAAGGVGVVGSYLTSSKLNGEKLTPKTVYWGMKELARGKAHKYREPSIRDVLSQTLNNIAQAAVHKAKGPQGVLYFIITKEQKLREEVLTEFMLERGFQKKEIQTLWLKLLVQDYLYQEEFTKKCYEGVILDGTPQSVNDLINTIFWNTKKVWQAVWKKNELKIKARKQLKSAKQAINKRRRK